MKNTLTLRFFWMVLFTALVFSSQVRAEDPIVGTWIGTVVQPGAGAYEMVMKMTSAEKGSTEYPSLKCGGTLTGKGKQGNYEFKESITHGKVGEKNPQGCLDGTIQIVMQGKNQLSWEWSGVDQGSVYRASAKLSRTYKKVFGN